MDEAEDLSELDKLKNAATMINALTHGRLEVRPSMLGGVYIHPEDSAYIGIELDARPQMALERYEITFRAQVRRMGVNMDLTGLRALMREAREAYALLSALELREYHPSPEDMKEFRDYLDRQQSLGPAEQAAPGLGQSL